MKTIATLSLLAAGALTLAPKPAAAGDKEIALIGGFLGGLIVASALEHDHDRAACAPTYDDCRPTVVVSADYDRCDGYWREVSVRTWVPACYETRYDCGRRVRVYVPGYYTYRPDRVWTTCGRVGRHDHHDRFDRDHDDRRYGYDNRGHDRPGNDRYGYGYNRRR